MPSYWVFVSEKKTGTFMIKNQCIRQPFRNEEQEKSKIIDKTALILGHSSKKGNLRQPMLLKSPMRTTSCLTAFLQFVFIVLNICCCFLHFFLALRIFYIGKKRSFPNIKLCLPKTALPNGATDTDTVSKKWNLQVYEKGFGDMHENMATEKYIYI